MSERDSRLRGVRLIVARCEVTYSGRLSAVLPEAVRLLILKGDGSVLVHDDAGGYKPLNWMTAPTFIAVERDLQEALAAAPEALGEALTLVRREWQTEIGPVDLMCHDEAGEWVAVEVKRIGTIEAVEQLTRYLDFIRRDPAKAGCRGILVAQRLKPQAVALAESRDIRCVAVDLAVLRGEREPDLTLFAA